MCRAWLMTVVSFRQFYMAASDTDSSCKKESIFDWDLLSIGHYQYVPPPHFMYRMSAIPPSPSDSILSSAERRVRENLISINKCIRAPPKSISILYCRRLLILLILRCISGKKRRYIHYILDYEWWECEVGYPMWTLGGGLVKYRKALRESCCHLWGIEIANMTSFLKRIVDIPLIFFQCWQISCLCVCKANRCSSSTLPFWGVRFPNQRLLIPKLYLGPEDLQGFIHRPEEVKRIPVKFSVWKIKTKTRALIGRFRIYAGKQSKQNKFLNICAKVGKPERIFLIALYTPHLWTMLTFLP